MNTEDRELSETGEGDPSLYTGFIEEAAAAWGMTVPAQRLAAYLALLHEKNMVMNLTAITEPRDMALRHAMDSLALIKLGLLAPGRLIDVGTGGGTPGIPLAIAMPQLFVTLNEPMQKRCDFLRLAAEDLENAAVLQGRAEELAKAPLRESFDFATARAVANLRQLAEYCLPYVKVGGYFLPMKAGELTAELREAKNAIGTLGGAIEDVLTYEVPGEGALRSVPVIRKIKPADAKYPRRTPRILKNPL
ncbi:MAG TPA: 16S rRNA (guanine(527)-N(7))-methyltransferase RsmG [Candidatus Acidoferrum sp.]|nr:16S rRNA (guanine(527)-N(7))-methyltransferase RsmG [Candidatus Acidoferrum sp.]